MKAAREEAACCPTLGGLERRSEGMHKQQASAQGLSQRDPSPPWQTTRGGRDKHNPQTRGTGLLPCSSGEDVLRGGAGHKKLENGSLERIQAYGKPQPWSHLGRKLPGRGEAHHGHAAQQDKMEQPVPHGSQTQTGESKLIRDHSLDTQGNFNCEILA